MAEMEFRGKGLAGLQGLVLSAALLLQACSGADDAAAPALDPRASIRPSLVVTVPVLTPAIALPVEALFPTTGEITLPFTVSDTKVNTAATTLAFRIFVETEDLGAIKVNDYSFRLRNAEVEFTQPIREAFGGFGSGYSVFDLQKALPAGVLRPGLNTITLTKDRSDGVHLGYRLLDFNFTRQGSSQKLLAASQFIESDPQSTEGLNTDTATVATGARLWREAALVKSPSDPFAMRAKCSDCHTATGYDLHYFGYSNNAIVQRARFHGLGEADGKAVAAYIRSLDTPGKGRPWNPPYQPGPGLKAKPVEEWAAGAGASAVLARDADALAFAFPSGIPAAYNFKGARLDLTDVPVALELPVWNHWLPRIHPMEDEAFGEPLTRTDFYRRLVGLSGSVPVHERGKLPGLQKQMVATDHMLSAYANDMRPASGFPARIHRDERGVATAQATERDDIAAYSLRQWMLVKSWESVQTNRLEGLGKALAASNSRFPASTPERVFYSGTAFRSAPHMSSIRRLADAQSPGMGNGLRDAKGKDLNWTYFSTAWYYLQLMLWDNFQQGDGFTHWPYLTAFSTFGSEHGGSRFDFPAVRLLSTLKSVEAFSLYPPGGDRDRVGFNNSNGYLRMTSETFRGKMVQITPAEKFRMVNGMLRGFVNLAASYPVSSLNKLNIAEDKRCANMLQVHSDAGCTSSAIYWLIFEWRDGGGVDRATLNRLIDIYSQVWPSFDWECSRQEKPASVCLEQNRKKGVVF